MHHLQGQTVDMSTIRHTIDSREQYMAQIIVAAFSPIGSEQYLVSDYFHLGAAVAVNCCGTKF